MDKSKLLSELDKQISDLGQTKNIFGTSREQFEEFVAHGNIDAKIASTRRKYYFYLTLSLGIGGLLYLAGFAQVFEFNFIDLSKSGLLIILAVADIAATIRNKIDLEKLKMVKNLFTLRQIIESE